MNLTTEEVIEIIDSGTPDSIKTARKWAKKNNMHLTGKGVKLFLETLDPYETFAQKIIREKLVRSNRSLFSFILRPMDKVFSAKGGSIAYNIPKEQIDSLKVGINEVTDGLDIKRYLKKVVRKHYLIDPNGLIFIDIDREGKLEVHIITTEDIFWYDNKGNKVHAIIFAPYTKEENKDDQGKKFYRVLDDSMDRIFVQDGDEIYEDTKERLDNYFGFVPAMILGDEKSPNYDIYESVIADVIEDADKILRDVSTMNIHDLAHLYPKYWSYAQACTQCQGEGEIRWKDKDGTNHKKVCPSCGGDGVKKQTNPSDEMVIPLPNPDERPITPNVAGFVSPDINTARFYREILEKSKNSMFQAMWGTTYEQGGKRETATGRFLDVQPVNDRLGDMSDSFAKFHKFILDCSGKVLLRNKRYEASVSYGKRYIFEGPDDILDKYIEGSREKISELTKIDLLTRYVEAEYQDDKLELAKKKKLIMLEPFPTMTVQEVLSSDSIPDKDKLTKLYFSEWVFTLADAVLVLGTLEQLKERRDKFINSKSIGNGETSRTSTNV